MSNDNKNTIFVEANVMNISAKFQLYPPYGFFEYFFLKFKFRGLDKNDMFGRGLLKEHFNKLFVKNICSDIAIKANFHFPHH